MELSPLIDAVRHAPSGYSRVAGNMIPAANGVHTDESTTWIPAFDVPVGGTVVWISTVRNASHWETILLVILFTLIAVLITVRTAETLSDRDLGVGSFDSTDEDSHPRDEESSDESPDDMETETLHASESIVSVDTSPKLLSDEGRVVQLLVKNGGQIRQHQITDETGWSKSKVSRILSSMADDGTIEKTTVGRENVISLLADGTDEPPQPTDSGSSSSPVP